MVMRSIHINTPARRARPWLLYAFAITLLTLLCAGGEYLGTTYTSSQTLLNGESLSVPAALHAIRSDHQHAGGAPVAADGELIISSRN